MKYPTTSDSTFDVVNMTYQKIISKYVYVIGHSPLGLFRTNVNRKRYINIQISITRLRIPPGGRQASWLFTSVAELLNSGLPRTTSTRSQSVSDH